MYALFIGSGNTLGLNLQLFNGNYDTKEKMEVMGAKELAIGYTIDDYNFMKQHRWSSQVSDKLNCFEINLGRCQGNITEHLYLLRELSKNNLDVLQNTSSEPTLQNLLSELKEHPFDFSDVKYIFLEFFMLYGPEDRYLSAENRTLAEVEELLIDDDTDVEQLRSDILKCMANYDSVLYTDLVMKKFVKEIEYLTKQNKKVFIVWWRKTAPNFEETERFPDIKKYAVKFPTDENKNNLCTEEFLISHKFTIDQDHPLGKYLPRRNLYGSINGHKLIAEKILDFINNT